jgi:hypothetical protein
MESRECWTCGGRHDLDEACRRTARQPGRPVPSEDFFDSAREPVRLGRIFMAQHESEDSCCGEGIVPGEDIRADGQGGWIHADDSCGRMVQE